MKRKGNLIPRIAELDNLYLAYYKARKGKTNRSDVLSFSKDLRMNLLFLQKQILEGEIETGKYKSFYIYDPKKRLICAADFSERVLHHALMNICHDRFEKYQIHDSYACRKDKGTYAALERAIHFSKKNRYFAKLDVKKYFETLDQNTLKAMLTKLFKDKKLISILQQIIEAFENEKAKGLPIGNLTSQYFANHYLAVADHFAKEKLGVKYYLRYMDDMVFWSDDFNRLKNTISKFSQFVEKLLKCELRIPVINSIDRGLPFLGYVIHPDKVNLAKRSRKRFLKKTKNLNMELRNEKISQETYQRKILPIIAFSLKADSYLFRKNYIWEKDDR